MASRFFADECCPAPLVKALRSLGHDVRFVVENGAGLDDLEQAKAAFAEGRILISADYGFGELAVRQGEPFVGLILLPPALKLEKSEVAWFAAQLIHRNVDSLAGQLTIFEDRGGVRQRAL